MIRRPPRSTRTDTLFPYTTLFRSRLSPDVETAFPFDADAAIGGDKILWDQAKLPKLVAQYRDLVARAPQLFPAHIATPEFITRFEQEAQRFLQHETTIKRFLHAAPKFIALCRSEERRVGKECVLTCKSRGSPDP